LARGAAGLLTEEILPVPLPQCVVSNADRAAAKLADALHGNPAEDLLIVGVVGAGGKTTTALLTAAMLRGLGQRTAYDTDLGSCDGVIQSAADSRQLGVLETSEFLADARDAGSAAVVLELSDDYLHSAGFRNLALDVLILTGGKQTPEDAGVACGLDLALEQLREGGVAIVNADSRAAMAAADRAGVPLLTYGLRGEANVSAKIFDQQPGETTLMVTTGDVTATMETGLTGPLMANNQLAAIAVGMLMQSPLHESIAALAKVRHIPGRLQRIGGWPTPAVMLDSCGSPQRLRGLLRGLRRERGAGRLWVVAAVGEGADSVDLAATGAVAEKYADRTIVTSASPTKAGFLSAAHDWLDGVKQPGKPRLIANRAAAIAWAIEQAGPADTIVVAGGWCSDAPALERSALACEEEMIRELLQARAEKPQPAQQATRSSGQQSGKQRGQQRAAGLPVILPHPALKS
jgi:UDP-N-acetylmuramoyl-L-alanyl-D-glutamate--2,6-diaminopimelate ligase